MDFKYRAQDKDGRLIIGTLSAQSVSALVLHLKNDGLLPLQVKETKAQAFKLSLKKFLSSRQVNLKELAVFSRQLSSTLNAGIPLVEAMSTITEDLHNRYFRRILEDVIDSVKSGSAFSEALIKYNNIFSETYISLIRAGEASGSLHVTTGELAKYLENTYRLKRKVKSAMTYPVFVFIFMVLILGIMVLFIIPKFAALFYRANVPLPLLTRLVVGVGEFVLKKFPWFALSAVSLMVFFWGLLRSEKVRFNFDRLKFKIPLIGGLIKKLLLLRFSRTLSILLSCGVGLATALPICGQVVQNLHLKGVIKAVKENIIAGSSLSSELNSKNIFPRMFVKMVQVGEKTGKISDMLARNADYYEEELEITLDELTSLVEPVLIAFVGGIVLVVVLALYLPIFQIAMAIRK